ncbi:MAG: hypothetical protein OXG65_09120 [Chloroflexi bacterium]|nr:hypothetical protein [Chloroflexota bacterium]
MQAYGVGDGAIEPTRVPEHLAPAAARTSLMPAAYPESVRLAITPGRSVLFADLLEVAEMHNARPVVSSASKHPANPVLAAGLIGR